MIATMNWVTTMSPTLKNGRRSLLWARLRLLRERFRDDRLGVTAGSLTFTTLIALVPLLTVGLAIFTAFPMFSAFQVAVEKYFLQNLVPDTIAKPLLRALTQFATKASRIGTVGVVVLGLSALALMMTIDRTINQIFRVRRQRSWAQRLLLYWGALTLGPLLLGGSLYLATSALSISSGWVGLAWGSSGPVSDLLQFVLLAACVAGLYKFVPHTAVAGWHAWWAGVAVAGLLEFAKSGLAWYVQTVPTISGVYGAFSVVPILLLWIYTLWVIVLVGAEWVAFVPSWLGGARPRPTGPGRRFELGLQIVSALHQARFGEQQGLPLPVLAATLKVEVTDVEGLAHDLVQMGWIAPLDEPAPARYVLLADPEAVSMASLMERLLLVRTPVTEATCHQLAQLGPVSRFLPGLETPSHLPSS